MKSRIIATAVFVLVCCRTSNAALTQAQIDAYIRQFVAAEIQNDINAGQYNTVRDFCRWMANQWSVGNADQKEAAAWILKRVYQCRFGSLPDTPQKRHKFKHWLDEQGAVSFDAP